jgi:hypothetical protein
VFDGDVSRGWCAFVEGLVGSQKKPLDYAVGLRAPQRVRGTDTCLIEGCRANGDDCTTEVPPPF